jgi:hypothetical protein
MSGLISLMAHRTHEGHAVKFFVVVRGTYNEIKQEFKLDAGDIHEAADRVRKKFPSHKGYSIKTAM